jgi:hypothetical protein
MIYSLNSENRYDRNVISQIGKSINFMTFEILLIISTVNNPVLIFYLNPAFLPIYNINHRILHNWSPPTPMIEFSVHHPFIFSISAHDNWIHTISYIQDHIRFHSRSQRSFTPHSVRMNWSYWCLSRLCIFFRSSLWMFVVCQCCPATVYFTDSQEAQTGGWMTKNRWALALIRSDPDLDIPCD